MQKFFVALGLLVALAAPALADDNGYDSKVISSHSDVATAGPVMVSSHPIKWVAAIVSSPAPNGYVAIYKSTESTFTQFIATWTLIDCSYQSINTNPSVVPLYEMESDSYTYVSRSGACNVTLLFKYAGTEPTQIEGRSQLFGLPNTGRRDRVPWPQ